MNILFTAELARRLQGTGGCWAEPCWAVPYCPLPCHAMQSRPMLCHAMGLPGRAAPQGHLPIPTTPCCCAMTRGPHNGAEVVSALVDTPWDPHAPRGWETPGQRWPRPPRWPWCRGTEEPPLQGWAWGYWCCSRWDGNEGFGPWRQGLGPSPCQGPCGPAPHPGTALTVWLGRGDR